MSETQIIQFLEFAQLTFFGILTFAFWRAKRKAPDPEKQS